MSRLLLIFSVLLTVFFASGQCSIDYSYYPTASNYGLDPDSLPDGYVGQFYDEDMTFFLPLDTVDGGVTVTFEDFHIISISLPLGLTWECNNSFNGCHYDPNVTQYGCVKVSGTALIPGNYNVQVDLVATHSLSSLVGPENISFTLPLSILPDTSTYSNTGFAMTNPAGCLPVTVSFTNNNTGMLSYYWDFGNGNTSTLQSPAPQIYNDTGMYIVQYSAIQTAPSYFLESIEVVNGTCTDNILIGDVDLFYTITTSAGVLQQVTNYMTQPFPLWINISNQLLLTGQNVTIEVWDDDSFWPITSIEDCGSFSFVPAQQAGTFSANGGGLSINYTVIEVPATTVFSSDTIYVYDYPSIPNVVYDTLNNIIYTSGTDLDMQWYYYNSPIPGATDTFIEPESSGLYSLVVVNEYGCTAYSLEVLVVICDADYQPILDDNGLTAWMLDSALYSNLQWYDVNGAVNGANSPFFPASVSGFYHIVATDSFGCSYYSESVFLGNSSTLSKHSSAILKLGPNPISSGYPLTIYLDNVAVSEVTIVLIDLYGREILRRVTSSKSFPYQLTSEEIGRLTNGLYYLDVSLENHKIRKKIIKSDY